MQGQSWLATLSQILVKIRLSEISRVCLLYLILSVEMVCFLSVGMWRLQDIDIKLLME